MSLARASFLSFAVLAASSTASAQTGRGSAVYEVTFDATWSAATHPGAYPAGAHFSAPVGVTHRATNHLWRSSGIASPGMEAMAELGATSTLSAEITAAIGAGFAGELFVGSAISSPGATSLTFTVTDEFPAVTLVSMVAPSPDWFVGTEAMPLFENGDWIEEKVVPLLAWEAGTDSGVTFNSANLNTSPQDPIVLITDGPFTGSDPLGTFTFRRQTATIEYGTCANPAGSLAITGAPSLGASFTLDVHDPGASMPVPSLVQLAFSLTADPAYPCGRLRPNWGLSAPGAAGELLQTNLLSVIPVSAWNGAPVSFGVAVPNDPVLLGVEFFAQAALIAPGVRVGLTSGVKMVVGP